MYLMLWLKVERLFSFAVAVLIDSVPVQESNATPGRPRYGGQGGRVKRLSPKHPPPIHIPPSPQPPPYSYLKIHIHDAM